MNLQNWVNQARKHWAEFRPTLYRDLKAKGILDAALQNAADLTNREMTALVESGFTEQEAWEMTREKYLFLPEEGSAPTSNDSPLRADRASATDLLHAAIKSGARTVEVPDLQIGSIADLKGALRGE